MINISNHQPIGKGLKHLLEELKPGLGAKALWRSFVEVFFSEGRDRARGLPASVFFKRRTFRLHKSRRHSRVQRLFQTPGTRDIALVGSGDTITHAGIPPQNSPSRMLERRVRAPKLPG